MSKDALAIQEKLEAITYENVLENSAIIYATPCSKSKQVALENAIRFGDLSSDELQVEKNKIDSLIGHAINNNIVVSESVQQFMVDTSKLINHRITNELDITKYERLALYENQLFDTRDIELVPTIESSMIGSDEAMSTVYSLLEHSRYITGTGIVESISNILSHPLTNQSVLEEATSIIIKKVKNTLNYEMSRDRYKDLPILESIDAADEYLKEYYGDKQDALELIDAVFDAIEDEIEDTVKNYKDNLINDIIYKNRDIEDPIVREEFNCNPFNSIYQMCPFPVGSRTVARTMNDCLNSESEEELIEALNKFSNLMSVCEMMGEDLLTEGTDSIMNKAKRNISRGASKVATAAKNVEKTAHAGKVAVQKTLDPMARFIEDTYDKIHKKDFDERKKAVMAKGLLKGKVMKISKWLKDVGIMGIALYGTSSIGFSVGTVIAAIALIGYIVRNANLNIAARKEVVKELEDELRITREKIEDSRGDEKKQTKYELMRIEDKLQTELNRIKMHNLY